MAWSTVAASTRAKRDAQIPVAWRVPETEIASLNPLHGIPFIESRLTARELEITNWTATEALKKIHSGEISSYEVTSAICHRAALAHAVTNCLTEIFFDEALERAKKLDAEFEKNGRKPIGPLHGLPVSIKEEFDLPGKLTTWGFVSWASEGPASQLASVPRMLLEAGAVLYCKTNVPAALLTWESDNFLWNHTYNPHNRNLGSGGSSGGEGALIGAGGSYLGVGTDIGGSIRLPGAINGLYSFKPSSKRFPYNGSKPLTNGTPEAITPVQGPIARSVEDLELYANLMVSGTRGTEIDPNCLGIHWRRSLGSKGGKRMKFGYFVETDYFAPVPPVRRAVLETVDALRKAGHEVVEFPITDFKKVYGTAMWFFGAYSEELKETLKKSGEPLIPGLQGLFGEKEAPPKVTELKSPMRLLWENYKTRDQAREEFLARFNAAGLDGLICPVLGIPSCKHFDSNRLGKASGYATYFNVLDLAAGTIPVTKVLMSDAPAKGPYRNFTEQTIQEAYDPETFLDCPISVQIVGRRWQEEKVFDMMYAVDDALKANPVYRASKI